MKLEIKGLRVGLVNARYTALMSHKDHEPIEWDVSIIEKMSLDTSFDIFEQINGYWASLPESVQDQIFAAYAKIKAAIADIWNMDRLTMTLYDLVEELYSHHDLQGILHYLRFHSNIHIPEGLKDSFKESFETPGTRERTYLKEDYWLLVGLTVALRAMAPVWGEFISRTERESGTTLKEYWAYRLLTKANLMKSEPMEKLRVFVEASLPPDKSLAPAIYGLLSSEDFPTWILALVVVRRLTVGDVRGLDPNASLVTFIYKYIGQKVKGHDNNFIGMVKEKTIEGQGQEGENNLSKLEGYKIKQEIPAGDIAIIRHYIRDVYGIARRIVPEMDLSLVEQSLASVRALENEQLWKPQMILMQWVLKPEVPPRGMMHLEKKAALEALAITQALLWFRGYQSLAGLSSAIALSSQSTMSLGSEGPRTRVPKEMVEELQQLFPFTRRIGGKSAKAGKLPPSVAVVNVELVARMFGEHDWRLTLPQEWVTQLTGSSDRRYFVPPDIKVQLAKLAVAIAKRKF